MSRCHYLDLTMDTTREKILRIKQIARDGGLFDTKGLTKEQEVEIIDFLESNQAKMRRFHCVWLKNLQTCARWLQNNRWKRIAETTCMKRV